MDYCLDSESDSAFDCDCGFDYFLRPAMNGYGQKNMSLLAWSGLLGFFRLVFLLDSLLNYYIDNMPYQIKQNIFISLIHITSYSGIYFLASS